MTLRKGNVKKRVFSKGWKWIQFFWIFPVSLIFAGQNALKELKNIWMEDMDEECWRFEWRLNSQGRIKDFLCSGQAFLRDPLQVKGGGTKLYSQ